MTECFDWNQNGLDEARFVALTNLLSLRNGGQMETPELDQDEDPVEEASDGEEAFSEADTEHPCALAESGHEELKTRFLDRLAEIVSRERPSGGSNVERGRKGSFVACTTLREAEDDVYIYVTRNNGLDVKDMHFFSKLENLLPKMSRREGALTVDPPPKNFKNFVKPDLTLLGP
ncbi:MAG: hypothetical protein M1837_005370 [Sclerophora amabilis]|nr:MAG: hypothetical protein M1837_005370 [Sclerophora amabilis]